MSKLNCPPYCPPWGKKEQDIGFSDALKPCHYGGVERI